MSRSWFTLLVGHDTNLANIGGMLGLYWSLPSYVENKTPPAGAMHFDLLRNRVTRAIAVRVRYIAQALHQMRSMAPLDLANPPETTAARISGCKRSEEGTCPWTEFASLQTKPSIARVSTYRIEDGRGTRVSSRRNVLDPSNMRSIRPRAVCWWRGGRRAAERAGHKIVGSCSRPRRAARQGYRTR
jgi:hypothetical protein